MKLPYVLLLHILYQNTTAVLTVGV